MLAFTAANRLIIEEAGNYWLDSTSSVYDSISFSDDLVLPDDEKLCQSIFDKLNSGEEFLFTIEEYDWLCEAIEEYSLYLKAVRVDSNGDRKILSKVDNKLLQLIRVRSKLQRLVSDEPDKK